MITLTVIALLLFPSNAWATQKLNLDPNTLGAILAALLTTLGGGGYYLKRNRDVKDSRDDLSTKTKIAIARDNAEQVIREKVRDYHDEVSNLRRDVIQMQQLVANAIKASQAAVEDVKALRQEMDQRFRDNSQAQQLERLLGPLSDLEAKLTRAIEITERKGGGYGD
jgi:hypothetical protein